MLFPAFAIRDVADKTKNLGYRSIWRDLRLSAGRNPPDLSIVRPADAALEMPTCPRGSCDSELFFDLWSVLRQHMADKVSKPQFSTG